MKVVVLDYSGHLPQADLSKKLAAKGLEILHLYCTDHKSGTANFTEKPKLFQKIEFKGISAGFQLNRYRIGQRTLHEWKVASKLFSEIMGFYPDFVIISNLPLLASFIVTWRLRVKNVKYIYWWQDVYSEAISYEVQNRIKFPGVGLLSWLISMAERSCVKGSVAVVAISDKFREKYDRWKLDSAKFHVYPNWSAPEDFRSDSISKRLIENSYVLYAGTLGLKHNPKVLLDLADLFANEIPELQLVVVSQGLGRDFLALPQNLRKNITLKDFVPLEELQNLLFYAEIAIAILEPKASEYSVPSKVMTYFCAGKAIVAGINADNQVAQYIRDSNSGYVVDTSDAHQMFEAIKHLMHNTELKEEMEKNSRLFAERNFSGIRASELFTRLMS